MDETGAEIPFTETVASASVVPVTCREFVATRDPCAGAVTVSEGAVVSSVTDRASVAVFPAVSLATTMIVFAPSARTISWLKRPLVVLTAADAPFTVTVAPGSDLPETLVRAIPVSPQFELVTDRLGLLVSTHKLHGRDRDNPAPPTD